MLFSRFINDRHQIVSCALLTSFAILLASCEKPDTTAITPAEKEHASAATRSSGINLSFLDTSVNPANDFYTYANGGWMQTTEIPADKSRYGAFVILGDKAREDVNTLVQNAAGNSNAKIKGTEAQQIADYYASFMDEAGVNQLGMTPINPLLEDIKKIQTYEDLAKAFGALNKFNVRNPINFYIDTDEKEPTQYGVYLVQSGLGLPDRDYYLKDDEKSQQLQAQYRKHISNMLGLAKQSKPEETADVIYSIEKSIAALQWPRTDLRDRDKTYNKVLTSTLAEEGTALSWPAYLAAAELQSDALIVTAPSYFTDLQALLPKYSVAQWKSYLTWNAVSNYAELLSTEFATEDFSFYGRTLRGVEAPEERWKQAINSLNAHLGDAVGKLYVEQHFSPEAKARMVDLVENLRAAYHEAILQLDWMSEQTKVKAIEKLNKFTPKIGYPDEWRDLSGIEIKADDLVGNYQRAIADDYAYQLNKLGKPVNRQEWFMTPQTVNAYYNPGMNEIVFPAAILQPPFFHLDADDAINYGAIGGVIGHEMGHGFDDQGAKSDGDGLLQDWWTAQDLTEFKLRTDKLVAQYSNFTVLDDVHLNGELTQGENIGDLSGLTIAHRAYKLSLAGETAPIIDGYTGEQRFFLGWGQVWANKYRDEELRRRILTDPHSPPRFRTNGVLRNMPEFYEAFSVSPENGMYLPGAERVKIW